MCCIQIYFMLVKDMQRHCCRDNKISLSTISGLKKALLLSHIY